MNTAFFPLLEALEGAQGGGRSITAAAQGRGGVKELQEEEAEAGE